MGAKLGRNDPCHCGSGKKYKQCHQRGDETRAREERELKTIGQWVAFQVAGLESNLPDEVVDAAGDDAPFRQVALFDRPAPGPQAHIALAAADEAEAEVKTLATAFSEISRVTGREPGLTPQAVSFTCHDLRVDSSKAVLELGYRTTPLPTLVHDTCEWLREQGMLLPR